MPCRCRPGKWALALPALLSLAAGAQETVEVGIKGYQFSPRQVVIRAGDSVRWTNQEQRTSHSVILPIAGVAESDRLFPGESWSWRFAAPGRHEYHCGPHPEMTGVIVVED